LDGCGSSWVWFCEGKRFRSRSWLSELEVVVLVLPVPVMVDVVADVPVEEDVAGYVNVVVGSGLDLKLGS
jgi:hypothetical protein